MRYYCVLILLAYGFGALGDECDLSGIDPSPKCRVKRCERRQNSNQHYNEVCPKFKRQFPNIKRSDLFNSTDALKESAFPGIGDFSNNNSLKVHQLSHCFDFKSNWKLERQIIDCGSARQDNGVDDLKSNSPTEAPRYYYYDLCTEVYNRFPLFDRLSLSSEFFRNSETPGLNDFMIRKNVNEKDLEFCLNPKFPTRQDEIKARGQIDRDGGFVLIAEPRSLTINDLRKRACETIVTGSSDPPDKYRNYMVGVCKSYIDQIDNIGDVSVFVDYCERKGKVRKIVGAQTQKSQDGDILYWLVGWIIEFPLQKIFDTSFFYRGALANIEGMFDIVTCSYAKKYYLKAKSYDTVLKRSF